MENLKKQYLLRTNDCLTILPFQGRRKKIKLNHVKYSLKSSDKIEIVHQDIFLQTTAKHIVDIEIIRTEEGYFKIKSLTTKPIQINDTYVYEALLNRNDQIRCEYNIIVFQKSPEETLRESLSLGFKYPFKDFNKVVNSNLNILLQGETGTGKSRLAKKIHEASKRTGDFVHINICSMTESIIESQIFGHKKGSFTGAISDNIGALARAHKGTLFLDEIDSLSRSLQTKLLLFLDSKMYLPIGAKREEKSDCRIICAAGKTISDLVLNKQMRLDFYFRISSGIVWNLPSLKESPVTIETVILNFEKDEFVTFDKNLIEYYKTLDWPGNIRQLLGHLERKVVLSSGKFLKYDMSDELLSLPTKNNFLPLENNIVNDNNFYDPQKLTMNYMKKWHAKKIFLKCNKNIVQSSKLLGITTGTLRNLMNAGK